MISLKLNSEIYSTECIKRVQKVYKDLANIEITGKKGILLLRFSNCKYDEKRTIKEFENYLIGVENSNGNS